MSKKKQFNYEEIKYSERYRSPLVKWYNTNLSKEDKFRLGLMSYPEYQAWQLELAKEAAEGKKEADTFWRNDTEPREYMSEDDYDSFLKENDLDVTNRAAVNFEELVASLKEEETKSGQNEETSVEDLSMEEILANVSRDLHGGTKILTPEEIQALFDAYNAGEDISAK